MDRPCLGQPLDRLSKVPELFSCDIGMLYRVIRQHCSEQNVTLAALSPPNTILPSAHVAKVVCLVARRCALPAPLATTHAAFNLREKRTGRPPSDRPSSTHWEEHTRCPTLTCHATRAPCSCGPPLLAAMNPEKLAKMASQVRTGGKGSVRRKKKAIHKTTTTDDKRLQNTLKRLGVNNIPAIEEVNLFKDNGTVIHFTNPKGALAPII